MYPSSPFDDELPPDEEPLFDEEPPPLGVLPLPLLGVSTAELSEADGAEAF